MRWMYKILGLGVLAISQGAALAGEVQVAVAANFAEPIHAIAAVLQKTTGHSLKVTLGATGNFYTQIRNGAPFDIFLAADLKTPEKLEAEGLTLPGSRFTYATGKLVLWSANPSRVDAQGKVLKAPDLSAAIEAVAEAQVAPNGLLIDYHLDKGNGVEAILELRRRFGADLPAILITADRSPHVRDEGSAHDVQVLSKPVKPAALRALMAQWRVQRVAAAE